MCDSKKELRELEGEAEPATASGVPYSGQAKETADKELATNNSATTAQDCSILPLWIAGGSEQFSVSNRTSRPIDFPVTGALTEVLGLASAFGILFPLFEIVIFSIYRQ